MGVQLAATIFGFTIGKVNNKTIQLKEKKDMKIRELLESDKQVKKNRKSKYGRIRIGGENIWIHRAISASGLSEKQLRDLKKPQKNETEEQKNSRKERERKILSKIKSMGSSTEVDHKNGNEKDNTSDNLRKMKKPQHTAKTNKTR